MYLQETAKNETDALEFSHSIAEHGNVVKEQATLETLSISQEQALQIGRIGAFIENCSGGYRDIEWAVCQVSYAFKQNNINNNEYPWKKLSNMIYSSHGFWTCHREISAVWAYLPIPKSVFSDLLS
jgi:hypothetical protein